MTVDFIQHSLHPRPYSSSSSFSRLPSGNFGTLPRQGRGLWTRFHFHFHYFHFSFHFHFHFPFHSRFRFLLAGVYLAFSAPELSYFPSPAPRVPANDTSAFPSESRPAVAPRWIPTRLSFSVINCRIFELRVARPYCVPLLAKFRRLLEQAPLPPSTFVVV